MTIDKTTLHPEHDPETDSYPKTSVDQVEGLEQAIEDSVIVPDISVNASVDANVGTPVVEVVKSGTDEAPVFTFNFKNLKGADGAQGPIGETGPSITLVIGTVSTIEPGQSAYALVRKIEGDNYALDLAIPRGAKGLPNELTIGNVSVGTQAMATITGESPKQVLNLVLPATTFTIGTVINGDEAMASITGEFPNQILNLVLPKGDTGLQALELDTVISVTEVPTTSFTGELTAAQFNRTPVINEYFPVILIGTLDVEGRSWIALAKITAIGSSYTFDLSGGFVETTGIQGEQGERGISALSPKIVFTSTVPNAGNNIEFPLSSFNRTPNIGDFTFIIYSGQSSLEGRSWLSVAEMVNTIDTNAIFEDTAIIETTGATGATGSQGEPGQNGIGFSDTTVQTFEPSSVTYTNGVATITGSLTTIDVSTIESEFTFKLPIEAGDNITIDANETGNGIIVSASGDSGVKLYKHILNDGNGEFVGLITTSSNSISNAGDIISQLPILGVYDIKFMCQGVYIARNGSIMFIMFKTYSDNDDNFHYSTYPISKTMTLTDTVTPL